MGTHDEGSLWRFGLAGLFVHVLLLGSGPSDVPTRVVVVAADDMSLSWF